MTDLELAVADALRLSEKSAENSTIIRTIKRNISVARSELIRAGVSEILAKSSNCLVEDTIITFCLTKMDDEKMQDKHQKAFEYQLENLRKSSIEVENEE